MPKIVIAGGPRTGKTLLAQKLAGEYGCPLRCTDDVIHKYSWADASLEVSAWLGDQHSFVVEGTIAVRALRHFLRLMPRDVKRPIDTVYYGAFPFTDLTRDQLRLMDGCNTIWQGIRSEVLARQIEVKPIVKLLSAT